MRKRRRQRKQMYSVVKHSYIRASRTAKSRAYAHVHYIQFRKGEDKEQGGRLFFNADRDGITGFEVNRYIAQQEDRGVIMHKLILSPGVNGVDMEDYTRELMEELGRAKGLELEYFSIIHRNTFHDHAHVPIMGKDKKGRDVFINARHDYALLREIGDRYLERYYYYERYLDNEIPKLMAHGYQPDKGDRAFELLLADLRSPRALEEIDERRRKGEEDEEIEPVKERSDKLYRQLLSEVKNPKSLDEVEQETRERKEKEEQEKEEARLKAVKETPDEEKVFTRRRVYTKHDRLEELEAYARRLENGDERWQPYDKYTMLWSWIGSKRSGGDDFYERTGEPERLKKLFDEELERSLRTNNDRVRPKGYRQYVFESRGRLLESSEHAQIINSRNELKKELEELDGSGVAEPERRQELKERLEWLEDWAEEERRDREGPTKMEKKLSPENAKEVDEKWAFLEESKSKTDARRNDDKEKDEPRKDGAEEKDFDKEKEEPRKDGAEEKDFDKEPEEREREEYEHDSLDQDERHLSDDERKEREAWEKEQRERQDEEDRQRDEAREQGDRDRLDQEERDREEQEGRDRDDAQRDDDNRRDEEARESQRRYDKQAKEEAERAFKLQQELEKLRQQQLEPEKSGKSSGSSRLQEKIDQYEQEIANIGNRQLGEPQKDFDRSEPSSLDLAQPPLDLDKNIQENWSLDEKAGPDEHEIDDLLNGLDRQEEQERPQLQSDINSVLFGDGAADHELGQHEKTEIESRLETWERNAYDPELIKEQQDRPDQEMDKALGDPSERQTSDVVKQQQQQNDAQQHEQQAKQEFDQAVQLQIQAAFIGPERSDDKDEHQHDDKDKDDGGERSR